MSRDSSLDEFLSDDDGSTEPDAEESPETDEEGDAPEPDAEESPETDEEETSPDPGANGSPEADDGTSDAASGASEDADVPDDVDPPADADVPDDVDPPADADPATPTMVSDPGGVDCDACGETVTRRWQEDDRAVCAACKEW